MKPEKKSTDQRLDEIVNMLNEKLFVKADAESDDDEEEDNKKSKPTELTEEDAGDEEGEETEDKKKVMPKLFSKSYEKLRSLKK